MLLLQKKSWLFRTCLYWRNLDLPASAISCGEGNGTPLHYSCLENPMDGGAWWAAVHGVAKSRTWLSDFTFTFHFHALEKEMATHSSILAWRIPGTGEPGGLPSMGRHRVRHDWSDLAAAAAAAIPCTADLTLLTSSFMTMPLLFWLFVNTGFQWYSQNVLLGFIHDDCRCKFCPEYIGLYEQWFNFWSM